MRHNEIKSNIIYDTSINAPNIRYTLIVSLTVKIFVWYVCQREIECTHYTYLKVSAKKLSSSSLTLVSCQRLCLCFWFTFAIFLLCVSVYASEWWDDAWRRFPCEQWLYLLSSSIISIFLLVVSWGEQCGASYGIDCMLIQMDATGRVENKGHWNNIKMNCSYLECCWKTHFIITNKVCFVKFWNVFHTFTLGLLSILNSCISDLLLQLNYFNNYI